MKAALRGARRRPGRARAADHAARAPRRARRARADVQARAASSSRSTSCIDEIGVDAARCFMLARSHDTTVDLDLDLAREQSSENPVYYVQYAHARIASMLAQGGRGARRGARSRGGARASASALHPAERALIKKLLAFPGEVAEAAERRAPHRIAAYALELAQDFTAFYRDCQVVGAEPARASSPSGSRSAWRRSARSRAPGPARGRARPTRCSARRRVQRAEVGRRAARASASERGARRRGPRRPAVGARRAARAAAPARQQQREAAGERRARRPSGTR